jgi:16S rRNA (guanine966-N2)-methyltransferase
MRIISGRYRKKQIFPPKNFKARPTTDVAKESLFNIIQNSFSIEELKVLDLFAGAGNISYEFASRESKLIHSVELNFHHFNFIKKTKEELGFDQMEVFKADAFRFVKKSEDTYDIIFADPPYEHHKTKELPDLIFDLSIVIQTFWN